MENEKVNINRADEIDLQRIIHIGPKRAEVIYTGRLFYNAKFKDIYELSKVLGLGTKRMGDIINQGIATV